MKRDGTPWYRPSEKLCVVEAEGEGWVHWTRRASGEKMQGKIEADGRFHITKRPG